MMKLQIGLMKKLSCFIVAALLAAAVTGCAASPDEAPPEAGQEASPAAESDPAEEAAEAPEEVPEEAAVPSPSPLPETAPLAYGEIDLPQLEPMAEGETIATMTTNYGDIVFRFFPEQAPKAVENFLTHAKDGYYDGVIFHRVVPGFAIQSGDPKGDGTGGESIWGAPFELEVTPQLHHLRGALSMANAGGNTNGSQFFIVQSGPDEGATKETYEDGIANQNRVVTQDADGKYVTMGDFYPKRMLEAMMEQGGRPDLDFGYSVFGQVIEGIDVVDAIASVEFTPSEMNPGEGKPVQDVVIEKIVVSEYAG